MLHVVLVLIGQKMFDGRLAEVASTIYQQCINFDLGDYDSRQSKHSA